MKFKFQRETGEIVVSSPKRLRMNKLKMPEARAPEHFHGHWLFQKIILKTAILDR